MVKRIQCPSCGSSELWRLPSQPSMRRCWNCGTEFDIETALPEPTPKAPPTEPEEPVNEEGSLTKETRGTSSTIGDILATIGLVILLIAGVIFLGFLCRGAWIDYQEDIRLSVEIDAFGNYEIPYTTCRDGQVVAEFGFRGEKTLMSVYPGVPGKDTWDFTYLREEWQITENVPGTNVAEELLNSRAEEKHKQLWIYCEGHEEKTGFFAVSVDLPKEGQQVVIRKKDE